MIGQPLIRRLSLVGVLFALAGGPAPAAAPQTPPGEGVFCAAAIFALAAEVGARCFPGQDPDLQAELRQSVAKIDAFILQNSTTTAAELETFKKEQAHVGAPAALLCQGDASDIYLGLRRGGPKPIRENADLLVSRPGPPTWGTCL